MIRSNVKCLAPSKGFPVIVIDGYSVTNKALTKSNNTAYELLRDYVGRRYTMENCSELREALKSHFKERFEKLGILNEWENFIDRLIK